MTKFNIPNPKQRRSAETCRSAWYPYYAGYNPEFVRYVLLASGLKQGDLVLDPWNGSGTTTRIAFEQRVDAVGIDINPAMAIVASSVLHDATAIPTLNTLRELIIDKAARLRRIADDCDPIRRWMKTPGATAVSHIRRAIHSITWPQESSQFPSFNLANISSATSFFYLALIRTARRLLARYRASNPTWFKVPQTFRHRCAISREHVLAIFEQETQTLLDVLYVITSRQVEGQAGSKVKIATGDSARISMDDNVVEMVLTSPPYCTRIDYSMATCVDLAVMGTDVVETGRALRESSIGTSAVRADSIELNDKWGTSCVAFLQRVANHKSKASRSYYLKTHLQYFHDLHRSLSEISRILRSKGSCVIVVQDSFYKDVHNDLPSIVLEMGESLGWSLFLRRDFPVTQNFRYINGASRKYRSSTRSTESVLWFTVSKSENKTCQRRALTQSISSTQLTSDENGPKPRRSTFHSTNLPTCTKAAN